MPVAGIEPASKCFEGIRVLHYAKRATEPVRGIEPPSEVYKTPALPLSYTGVNPWAFTNLVRSNMKFFTALS